MVAVAVLGPMLGMWAAELLCVCVCVAVVGVGCWLWAAVAVVEMWLLWLGWKCGCCGCGVEVWLLWLGWGGSVVAVAVLGLAYAWDVGS